MHYACNRRKEDQRELPSNEGQSERVNCHRQAYQSRGPVRTDREKKLTSAGDEFQFYDRTVRGLNLWTLVAPRRVSSLFQRVWGDGCGVWANYFASLNY